MDIGAIKNFLKKKMRELQEIRTTKNLERIIGVISYSRYCVKDVEIIVGPLREGLKPFKVGAASEEWIKYLNEKVRNALGQTIANVHWLILLGVESDRFTFVIESNWRLRHAGYMLFASEDGEENLLDLGSQMHSFPSFSYSGELDELVWVCKGTKTLRGMSPVFVRTDNLAIVDKWKSKGFYDNDMRIFRRWGWLLVNEPEVRFECIPGKKKIGANLLSRPHFNKMSKDTDGQDTEVGQVSIWDEIWAEHMKDHWGTFKTLKALQEKGFAALWSMVKRICELCEVCAKSRHRCARAPFGQPFSSAIPGHTVYGDVIGPLQRGRGGAVCIHCLIDYATRLGYAKPL